MSYDLIGEITQFLQHRQYWLEEELILKQKRRKRALELYKNPNLLKHFAGALLRLLFRFSTQGVPGEQRREINQYAKAIAGLRESRFDRAIQLLGNLEWYFGCVVEREILLQTGPSGTQFERVVELKKQLIQLNDEARLNTYCLCSQFLSCAVVKPTQLFLFLFD